MIHYDFPLESEMAKTLIAKLKSEGCDTLCIFGAGIFGCGYAYTFLTKKLGLKISFFCDNNSKLFKQKLTEDSIEVLTLDDLQKQAQKCVCFCCLSMKYQNDVLEQLEKMQIAHIVPLTPSRESSLFADVITVPAFFRGLKKRIVLGMKNGLGNQLFTYALYMVLKKRYPHRDIEFDISFFETDAFHPHGYKYALSHFFGIDNILISKRKFDYEFKNVDVMVQNFETYFFCPIIFDFSADNSEILLLPQVDVYIENALLTNMCYMERINVKEDIKQTLNLGLQRKTILSEYDKEILHKIENTNSVFIHVRRWDVFRSKEIARICDLGRMDFYESSLKEIEQRVINPEYFVFTSSDGLDYCIKNFSFLNNVTFVAHDPKDVNIDLLLMSKCKHSIFSFSSMAWWAAFLNDHPQKTVVSGKYYARYFFWQEISVPSHWIRIDNSKHLFEEESIE